jgi:GNAT superfamily N-acetyltransferase
VQEKLIVRIADRPDLAAIVAGWLWHEWWHQDGYTLEQTYDAVAAFVSPSGPPQSFVLLVDGKPIGTASLVAHDLDERPDLTPWLAGVFVSPEARGRGNVIHLIHAVEAACRASAISVVWLYTAGAERVYARAGWQSVESVQRHGRRPVTLMRRDLTSRDPDPRSRMNPVPSTRRATHDDVHGLWKSATASTRTDCATPRL